MNTSEVESIVYRKRVGNTFNILTNDNDTNIKGRTIANDGTTYKVVERNGKKYLELDMVGNPHLKKAARYVCDRLERDGLTPKAEASVVHAIPAAEVVREA